MPTRAAYRTGLQNKLLALEDGGYGDFEYSIGELNSYLDLSCLRMFPAVYRRQVENDLPTTSYGTQGYKYVTPVTAILERVYLVEDSTELQPVASHWLVRGSRIIQLPGWVNNVNVHWIEPFIIPTDDTTESGIPDQYTPLVVLGALIEALEARQDTGVRGEPPPTGPYFTTQLLQTLIPRYDRLLEQLAMGLPGMTP